MTEPIAISAAACRFPDADDPERFWDNLAEGVASIGGAPADRWRDEPAARFGAFLADVRGFDAGFFGFSAEEAEATDPQQRILLETAHEALERAGLAGPRRRGRTVGVFVGVGQSDYQEALLRILWSGRELHPAAAVGNLRNLIAARVAHAMDLAGPALAVDTACSSSLVALHLACESIRRGECDAALGCGVTLNLSPTAFVMLARAGALSPTGRLRPFARGADGIALGEGVGAVVLERLADALARGAPVLAVIRGSAVNNDGRTFNPMAPSPAGQIAVMREAWRRAGLDPKTANYVEAHGTGTRVGDSVEARSLGTVFGGAGREPPLALGSVKGNVGHMLSAAGMPSVIKVALALARRTLPPTLHAADVEPRHGLGASGLALVERLGPWEAPGPLRAGINGFGFGGTNAHLILEEAPERPARARSARPRTPLWTLSAGTDTALRATARRLAEHLRAHPGADLADVALAASVSHDPMEHRLALVGGDRVAERLEAWAEGRDAEEVLHGVVAPDERREVTPDDGAPVSPAELAARFVRGQPFDRLACEETAAAAHVPVPTYPFERRPYWASAPAPTRALGHPHLVEEVELTIDRAVLSARIAPDDPLVAQHVVHGVHILPGAACIELMRAAARHALGREPAALAGVTFTGPVRVEDAARTLRVSVERRGERIEAAIAGEDGEPLARALVLASGEDAPGATDRVDDPLVGTFEPRALYEGLAARGMAHGPHLRAVRSIDVGARSARAELVLPEEARGRPFGVSPALLDAAMQPVAALLLLHARDREGLYVPLHVDTVELRGEVPPECTARVDLRDDPRTPSEIVRCDVEVRAGGEARLRLVGLHLRRVTPEALRRSAAGAGEMLRVTAWEDAAADGSLPAEGHWLVVPAEHPASAAVAQALRDGGAECERVELSEVGDALGRGGIEGLVFLGATGPGDELASVDALDATQRGGVLALHGVARALDGLERSARPARMLVVTAGATDGGAPERATTLGLGLALSDELPGVACRVVDLPTTAGPKDVARLVALEAASAGDGVVRWRGGKRQRRGLAALDGAVPEPPTLRDDGVYLITGGAEGIGHAVARRLAAPGRTIVLVGRTPLDRAPERAERVRSLGEGGARVEYVACDVADPDAVRGLVARLLLDHGGVHGVVHAAGVAEPGRIGARGEDTFAAVLAPKVRGTWLLWRELSRRGIEPDFVALFSSVSASLPGLGGGLGDYVAANAFLDAFAQARRTAGGRWTSIAWSVWSETGMGADPMLLRAMRARGLPGIPTAAGVSAFTRALALERAHVAVAPMAPAASAPVSPKGAQPKPSAATAAGGPLVDELRALLATALEVPPEQVPVDVPFLSMGLDSLQALELVKVLEERHGLELPTTLFFEQETVSALAAYLEGSKRRGDDARGEAPVARHEPREAALSPTQLGFVINQQLYPDLTAFSFLRQTMRGELSVERLEEAARAVARRHPMLRASVDASDPRRPVQRIADEVAIRIRDHGVTGDVEALSDAVVNEPFDLARPPLWRIDVAHDAGGQFHHVLLCAHHAVADAWSLQAIASDLWRAYAGTLAPEPPATSFLDSIDAPRPALDADLAWWRERLAGAPALALPWDGDPEAPPEAPLATVTVRLDRARTEGFLGAARAAAVSAFHLSLAAYVRCLARWSGSDDVVVNVARARRELRSRGMAEVVGCFADTLPLRIAVRPDEPLAALARRVRDEMLAVERHGSPTSLELARLLGSAAAGPRVASPASYSFARFPLSIPEEAPELASTAGRTASAATRLGLAAWEADGALCFAWSFPERLFRRETVERLAGEHLAEHAAAALDAAPDASVPRRIVERLAADPEAVVLRDGSRAVRAAELDRASASIAAALVERGIGRGDVVALLADQGFEAVAAIVGILRTGAAWLPLDGEHPPARLRDAMTRAGAELCLASADGEPAARAAADSIPRASITELIATAAPAPPLARVSDDDLAYVIFTSGSTGRPKGVPIVHGAMRGYLDWVLDTFGYGPDDVLLGTSSPCFDASVRQLLAPLLAGATLVTCPRALARDPQALLEAVEREGVTVLSTVPSLLARLVQADPAPLGRLRWLKVGGETLPPGLVRALHDRLRVAPPVVNLYGPTETTINVTYHVVRERPADDEVRVPIGRPVAGVVVHVLDERGRAVPEGTPGELCVGGRGLSPGYLGEPELTARAFVRGPGGDRVYRTGDRVVLRPDGALDFLGRLDDQVKVHGHRIEPGEIEAALARHPAVALAVVRAVGEEPHRRLEAWIEPRGEPPSEDALRAALRETLPEPMWPRRFHLVEAMPVTPTGKVDRDALDAAATAPVERRARGGAPETATERAVARAFEEVLGIDRIGRDDDFFDLGGDSMGVLEVFARLERTLDRLPRAATLYASRTVRALAEAIDAHDAGDPEAARPTDEDDADPWFPLSPTQRGFLLSRAVDPETPVQWTARLVLEGDLDFDRFREAVRLVMRRHPMLRTVVDATRRPPAQRVLDDVEPPLELVTPCDAVDVVRVYRELRAHRFDPAAAPPFLLRLCRLSATHHVLVVAADHLIGDALSGWILARELLATHDALAKGRPPDLPPLRATFRTALLSLGPGPNDRGRTAEDVAYWRRVFERPYAPPRDWYAPESEAPARQDLVLGADRVDALREAARRRRTSLFELLLAAWTHALSEITGRDDLVMGTALAGRDLPVPDVQRLFGPFATAVPVRVQPVGRSPDATLDTVRRAFAEARAHALSPGEIARALPRTAPVEVASGTQLFFTFMDFEAVGPLESETLRVRWDDSQTEGDVPRHVDLHLAARRVDGSLRLGLHAAAHALGPEGLGKLADRLVEVLDALAAGGRAGAVRFGPVDERRLDAALIGYLPSPLQAAAAVGLASDERLRETLRAQLFPEGRPRWLERLETPLGISGLLCLPLFSDEIVPERADEIADRIADAVTLAGAAGIRSASLAGMLPARTGYGHAVLSRLNGGPRAELTTGHATTVVAVARTVIAAAAAAGVDLAESTVAFVGIGSIGGAAAELLLQVAPHPRRIVLCDLSRAARRMNDVANALRGRAAFRGGMELVESGAQLPEAVYRARIVVGAASTPGVLDVARLAPGTVVVDDSFPHLFNLERARARMRSRGDVLLAGGGLLACGPITRTVDVPETLTGFRSAIARALPRAGVASCQLEPLLRRLEPDLPATIGLVDPAAARRYWDAATRAGITAAPLHLGPDPLPPRVLESLASRRAG